MQLRLELAESPAPAVALWELVGEQQRQTAMSLLAAMIAQTVVPEERPAMSEYREQALARLDGRDVEPGRRQWSAAGDGVPDR